jgi:hypothetical protein
MARSINAAARGDLQRGLREVNKDIARMNRTITGADSEPVKAAATVLRNEWRRLLSVQGRGEPSSPGSPPHKQGEGFNFKRPKGSTGPARRSGPLFRSIRHAVVEGVRRVGSGDFRSRLHEFGAADLAPRPHARPALENVADKMGEVLVSESQRAVEKSKAI